MNDDLDIRNRGCSSFENHNKMRFEIVIFVICTAVGVAARPVLFDTSPAYTEDDVSSFDDSTPMIYSRYNEAIENGEDEDLSDPIPENLPTDGYADSYDDSDLGDENAVPQDTDEAYLRDEE